MKQCRPYFTENPLDNELIPLHVQPIYNEEKIREILHVQEPREELYRSFRVQLTNQEQKERLQDTKLRCYWREIIPMEGVPLNTVKAFWNPEKRCVIVTARYFKTEDMREFNLPMKYDSKLNEQIRWDEEKNLYRFKQVLPVPKYVCTKHLECYLDTERKVFILCARRNTMTTINEQRPFELENDCTVQGREYEHHQRCQPVKAFLKLTTPTTTSNEERWQYETRRGNKYLTETPEEYYVSKKLREQMKEIKRATFPGVMQSPRFEKDEKTNQIVLRLQFRLREAIFRPEDVQIHVDEKRRVVVIEAKREVRENVMLQQIHILREFTLPEIVELNKLKYRFFPEEGILRVELPLIREKFLTNQKF